nr:hypothetical protein CFP56_20860 [Quercus suber]
MWTNGHNVRFVRMHLLPSCSQHSEFSYLKGCDLNEGSVMCSTAGADRHFGLHLSVVQLPVPIGETMQKSLGSGILFTYPNIAALAGVQGLLVYALASGLPLLIFAALGPIIRRKCPEGFVLTEWTRQRYGAVTALYLSFLT